MSRDEYGGRGPQRWDTDRFTRESARYDEERSPRRGSGFGARPGERSVDESYERRVSGPRGYEDDRFRERVTFEDDESRYRPRRESVTIEKEREREFYNPSPPRRAPARPGLLRRQSSLDTFDRIPLARLQREEYGPPARREDFRPAYAPPPLPRSRALLPPRRYAERDFEEIKISEPDYYGDEEYRPYPERVREREIIRTRRRSPSRSRSRSRSRSTARESRARSSSSSSSSSDEVVVEKKFPKRGKTRMPARLVSIKAIIDLGYPYEQEGDVVIIQKALGPDNIDDVLKLSETYKKSEKVEMSGGRSQAGEVIEERREEFITVPPYHGHPGEVIEKRTFERRELSPPRSYIGRSRSAGPSPRIVDARDPIEIVETLHRVPAGPLVILNNRRDDRAIRAEIRALEAEQKAVVELERSGRLRSGDLVVYKEVVKKEREPSEGVVIKRDKKAAQQRALATMLKTLT